MSEMQFTGERLVPGAPGTEQIYHEHLLRYLFAQQFTKGKRVLDAACGTGYGSAILANGALSVTGVDISDESIEYSRTHYRMPNLDFQVMDCCHMGFPDGTFDVAVAFEIIEHIQDAEGFLREIRRVLKDTGLLVISTPNSATYQTENPFHVHEYSRNEFKDLLEKHFPNVRLYAEDYLLFLAVRGSVSEFLTKKRWEITPSENLQEYEPDYFLALCTCHEHYEAFQVKDFLYELPAEIINQKDFRIVQLQKEVEERTSWALTLDSQVKEMDRQLQQIRRMKAYRVYRFVKNLLRRGE